MAQSTEQAYTHNIEMENVIQFYFIFYIYIYNIDLRETFWMDIIRHIRTARTNQSPSMASAYAVIDSQANWSPGSAPS